MGLATSGAGKAFDLANWRESIQTRREIVRTIIVQVAVEGERLDPAIDKFKRAVGWYRLADRDKNVLNVMFHDIRSIVWNWALIPVKDQQAFIAGKIVPSTMAKQARALATPSS